MSDHRPWETAAPGTIWTALLLGEEDERLIVATPSGLFRYADRENDDEHFPPTVVITATRLRWSDE